MYGVFWVCLDAGGVRPYVCDMGERKAYRTDVSDEQWALLEPVLTGWRERRRFIKTASTPLREIVNAILYQNRTGCQWDLLPHDFPPPKTVYDYFAAWRDDGTDKKIHDLLRGRVRRAAGRGEQPSAMCLDSQSVDSSFTALAETAGYDGGKRRHGRKRHLAVDTMGLVLEVSVTAADVPDLWEGERLLDAVHAQHPTVVKAWADYGYRGLPGYARDKGVDVQVTSKVTGVSGFAPVPQRWKLERTFGWLTRSRRLTLDYETLPASAQSQIRWTMIGIMLRRLTGRSPVTRYRTSTNAASLAAT